MYTYNALFMTRVYMYNFLCRPIYCISMYMLYILWRCGRCMMNSLLFSLLLWRRNFQLPAGNRTLGVEMTDLRRPRHGGRWDGDGGGMTAGATLRHGPRVSSAKLNYDGSAYLSVCPTLCMFCICMHVYTCIRLLACLHVRVCVYLSRYVCPYAWMYACMFARMRSWVDGIP